MSEDNPIVITDMQLKKVLKETVLDTLTQLGIEHQEPFEMQKDFQHLRELRVSTEEIKKKGLLTLVGIFAASSVGVIVLGLKDYFGN